MKGGADMLQNLVALLLASWLLAVSALAVDEAGGVPDESSPVSDDASGDTPVTETEVPAPDAASPEPSPASSDDTSPEEEASADDAPAPSDDTQPFPADTSSSPEAPTPVVEAPPSAEDSVPVDPDPVPDTSADTPTEVPDVPAEVPMDPPVTDAPAEVPTEVPPASSGGSEPVPDPLPVYPIPDTSTVVSGLQEVPADVYDTPVADTSAPQVFTITTIPEFALAAIEPDADNTMSQAVKALFGTYTPRVQTVATYYNGEQIAIEEQYVPGVAGLDWEWLGGFAVFCIMLYCLFRLLGGSVKYG